MKNLLLYLMMGLTYHSYCQRDGRSFYETVNTSANRPNFQIIDNNGQLYLFAMREMTQSQTYSKLAHGAISGQLLRPQAYQYIDIPLGSDSLILISGAQIQNNIAELCVFTKHPMNTNGSQISFFKIDLNTNTFISRTNVSGIFGVSYEKASVIGNELVVYAHSMTDNKVKRISKSLTSSVSEETLPISIITTLNYATTSRVLMNAGVEYAAVVVNHSTISLVKRLGVDNYSAIDVLAGNLRCWDFDALANNTLLYSNGNGFRLLNQNLEEIDNISITYQSLVGACPFEFVEVNNKKMVIVETPTESKKYELNANYTIADIKGVGKKLGTTRTVVTNGKEYIFGEISTELGNTLFNGDLTRLIALAECDGNVVFHEYERKFELEPWSGTTSNNGSAFHYSNDGLTSGLHYHMNGVGSRVTIFGELDQFIGKVNGELFGIYKRFLQGSPVKSGPAFSNVQDINLRNDRYNKAYFVTTEMIQEHIARIQSNDPDYVMSDDIFGWPAHGNTSDGESAQLANFVDVNNNGLYEPQLGEYPKIFGNNCFLSLYHLRDEDDQNKCIEAHRYLFNFNCDTSEVIQNTLFSIVRYINRGVDITDAYMGTLVDFDLGYNSNDFIGTHVGLAMVYAYNGEPTDFGTEEELGFEEAVPAMGKMILSGMKLAPNGMDDPEFNGMPDVYVGYNYNSLYFGDGIVDNEIYTLTTSNAFNNTYTYPLADPYTLAEHYNVLSGMDAAGDVVSIGKLGRYAYLGDSDPYYTSTGGIIHSNADWEYNDNTSGDRRILGASGPGDFYSGDTLDFISAYVLSYDPTNQTIAPSVNKLFSDAAKIKQYFLTNDFGCGNSLGGVEPNLGLIPTKDLNFEIYPNPFNNVVVINHEFVGEVSVKVLNMNGQIVFEKDNVKSKEIIQLEVNQGMYFVELSTTQGKIVKKMVKK